jgi:glycosyltransferase involved in cell wall biosynthesis
VQPGSRLEWYESAGRVALRFLDAVVTVSDELYRDQRLSHIRHDRLHRVINGIDGPPPEKREQVVRRLAGDSNTRLLGEFVSAHRIIGYVGRLSAEKNPLVLLESLRILREQGKDVRLLMIGDGALKAEILHAARRLNVAQDVLLTGFRADARALMPVMDVIALSSLTEGLPVVLLEAMHAQVPVIAPAVGGICELLNGGAAGVLLRSVTPQDLADGIRSVLDDDALRDRIVCEATRVIEQRFTVGAMTDAYEQIYAGVLVRRRPGLQSRQGDGPVE